MNLKSRRFWFFIGLLDLPYLFGNYYITFLLAIVWLFTFISDIIEGKNLFLTSKDNKKVGLILLLIIVSFSIAYVRSSISQFHVVLYFISFHLFTISFIVIIVRDCHEKNNTFLDNFRKWFLDTFVLMITLNLILWAIGIKSLGKPVEDVGMGSSVILAQIGFHFERVNFIFSKGINSYAVILGAIYTFYFCDLFLLRRYKLNSILYTLIILFCLLLTDSRSAIILPFIILVIALVIRKLNLKLFIKLSAVIFILIPLSTIIILPILPEINFFNQISRNATDLYTLNGRVFIWFFAVEEFSAFKFIHLFGYGYFGHFTSGVSPNYSFVLANQSQPDMVHPHNSILSLIFDIGYLGLMLIIISVAKMSDSILSYWNKNKNESLSIYCLLLFIIFISITESFIGLYYVNSITLFIGVLTFLLAINPKIKFKTGK